MYTAMGEAVTLSKGSAVRGHHVYKASWTPYVGQRHAVSVRKATYACATGPSTRGGALTIQTFQTRKFKGGGGGLHRWGRSDGTLRYIYMCVYTCVCMTCTCCRGDIVLISPNQLPSVTRGLSRSSTRLWSPAVLN